MVLPRPQHLPHNNARPLGRFCHTQHHSPPLYPLLVLAEVLGHEEEARGRARHRLGAPRHAQKGQGSKQSSRPQTASQTRRFPPLHEENRRGKQRACLDFFPVGSFHLARGWVGSNWDSCEFGFGFGAEEESHATRQGFFVGGHHERGNHPDQDELRQVDSNVVGGR